MKEAVITGAARTAIGSLMGGLSDLPAPRLGAVAIAEAVSRSGIRKEDVEQVIMGNVLSAGMGQAPARQAGIYAGIPVSAGALTINKMCGSGLKAVMLAAQAVATEEFDVLVAGGMESMSQAPYLLKKARSGYRLGNDTLYDHMIVDGLWDVYNDLHMGNCAETLAKEHKITREDQDAYAASSYTRALTAIKNGKFTGEIVPVPVPQRKGDPVPFLVDEEPGRGNVPKLPTLRSAFEKNGTVTAGNASTINDGAAAIVVMSSDAAKRLGAKPMARIVGYATASLEPVWFTIAPVDAIRKLLPENRCPEREGRPLRNQRSVRRGGDRRHPGAGPGSGARERERRRGGAGASRRMLGGADPHHAPLRDVRPGRALRSRLPLHRRGRSRRGDDREAIVLL